MTFNYMLLSRLKMDCDFFQEMATETKNTFGLAQSKSKFRK